MSTSKKVDPNTRQPPVRKSKGPTRRKIGDDLPKSKARRVDNNLPSSKVTKIANTLQGRTARFEDVPGNVVFENAVRHQPTKSQIKKISAQHLNFLGTLS